MSMHWPPLSLKPGSSSTRMASGAMMHAVSGTAAMGAGTTGTALPPHPMALVAGASFSPSSHHGHVALHSPQLQHQQPFYAQAFLTLPSTMSSAAMPMPLTSMLRGPGPHLQQRPRQRQQPPLSNSEWGEVSSKPSTDSTMGSASSVTATGVGGRGHGHGLSKRLAAATATATTATAPPGSSHSHAMGHNAASRMRECEQRMEDRGRGQEADDEDEDEGESNGFAQMTRVA